MTEFERALSDIIFSETSSDELSVERVVDLASKIAPNILQAARKQIASEIDDDFIERMVDDKFGKTLPPIEEQNDFLLGRGRYRQGIEDTLKAIKEGGK